MKCILFLISLSFGIVVNAQIDSHKIALDYMNIIESDDPTLETDSMKLIAQNFITAVLNATNYTNDSIRLSYYYWYLGDINLRLKNYRESLSAFSFCLGSKIGNSDVVYFEMFQSYRELGENQNAISTINQAIEKKPLYEDYYLEKLEFCIENKIDGIDSFCLETLHEYFNFNRLAYAYLEYISENEPKNLKKKAKNLLKNDDRIFICYYFLIKLDYDNCRNSKKTKFYLNKLQILDTQKLYFPELKIHC